MLTPGQFFNWAHFNNPTVTRLLNEATLPVNTSKRVQLYWQAQRIIMDQAAMLLIRYNEDLEIASNRLRGVLVTKGGYSDYYTAYLQ